jgi:hypothetical protein
LIFLPVGRDLENGGSAESAMGEKHFFAEGVFPDGSDNFGGNSREFGIAAMLRSVEYEGNERGTRGNKAMAELAGEVVAERGGAHFGDGEAAGSNDENGRAKFFGAGAEDKFGGALNFRNAGVDEDLDLGGAAFGFEKIGDFGGRVVAEKLAERFFVKGDAMLLDESEEIGGSEAGESGFRKAGIFGEEILGRGVKIGEIAAATAGDQDFFADAIGVLNDRDAAAAPGGLRSAEKAGGAAAENEYVEGARQGGLSEKRVFSE